MRRSVRLEAKRGALPHSKSVGAGTGSKKSKADKDVSKIIEAHARKDSKLGRERVNLSRIMEERQQQSRKSQLQDWIKLKRALAEDDNQMTAIRSAVVAKNKRIRLSVDQRTVKDASKILASSSSSTSINPLHIDHVIDTIFGFVFAGPEGTSEHNVKDICNYRLVCQTWNNAGIRLLKRHCRIAVGATLENPGTASTSRSNSPIGNNEHDLEEELTLSILPMTLNLRVEQIKDFITVMKSSPSMPFTMFSFRESLFSDDNGKAYIELLQACGPSMEQLIVTMEPTTATSSFLAPHIPLPKLRRLKIMMKHSKRDYAGTALRQFKMSDRVYPIDGINGIYFVQTLCNGATSLDRLDIHWVPTLIQWSSTFGLKDLFLPKTITKLTLDTMNTNGATVKNLLLHDDVKLKLLKWSIGLPLATLTREDVTLCLKRHANTLRSLYFSIWISKLHHERTQLIEFPPMPNVEQLSLMGDGGQVTPFSFPKIFPKLSSLTLYHQMVDFLGNVIPSTSVKVVRILGAPIQGDIRNILSKSFPNVETVILFPQRDLHSTDYLVSMFTQMGKLRILLSHISRSDPTAESCNTVNKEEDLPNGLYIRTYRRSTYIVRIESGNPQVSSAVSEALEHLDAISRNPPFTLDAAAFSYL